MTYTLPDDLAQQVAALAENRGSSIEQVIREWVSTADIPIPEPASPGLDNRAIVYRLRQAEMRYRAVVESQIDLVCRYTPDTTLVFVNDAYCRHFGKSREALLGVSFLTLSPAEQHESIHARIREMLQDPRPEVAVYRSYLADGGETWIQWVDHGITDANGQVTEIQAVGRDITELKALESQRVHAAALEAELAKERELMAIKDQFASIVSHEFRTPLTVIRMSIEMLRHYADHMTPERHDEHLQRIAEQIANMTQLLDDILILDRARAGAMTFQPEPLNLVTLCRSVIDHFRVADSQRHDIVLHFPQDPMPALVDARFLNRILGNLLSNAIKYSPAGSQVLLAVKRDAGDVLIQVEDQGIGIPEDEQARIFDSFFRAKNAHDFDGTGLGLAIVQQHVQAHGGSISFTSQPGRGTIFHVRLPQPA